MNRKKMTVAFIGIAPSVQFVSVLVDMCCKHCSRTQNDSHVHCSLCWSLRLPSMQSDSHTRFRQVRAPLVWRGAATWNGCGLFFVRPPWGRTPALARIVFVTRACVWSALRSLIFVRFVIVRPAPYSSSDLSNSRLRRQSLFGDFGTRGGDRTCAGSRLNYVK